MYRVYALRSHTTRFGLGRVTAYQRLPFHRTIRSLSRYHEQRYARIVSISPPL